jgi:hypothetical protein
VITPTAARPSTFSPTSSELCAMTNVEAEARISGHENDA